MVSTTLGELLGKSPLKAVQPSQTAIFRQLVRDHMDDAPPTVPRNGSCAEVVRMMREHQVSGVVITSRRGGLIRGIITEQDITRHVVYRLPESTPLDKIMSSPVLTIDQRASAAEAAILMFEARIHHLVVTHDERPVGVMSSFDLLQALIPAETASHEHQAHES